MKIYEKYFGKEIYIHFIFSSFALCSLLLLFDFITELGHLNSSTSFIFIILSTLLRIPGNLYDLTPIAILISTIYVLAQSAALSEWTIFRLAGLSPSGAFLLLIKIGIPIALFTILLGEVCVPLAARMNTKLQFYSPEASTNSTLSSGIWLRSTLQHANSNEKKKVIVYIQSLPANKIMKNITIYEFNFDRTLKSVLIAKKGEFIRPNQWKLNDIRHITFQPYEKKENNASNKKLLPSSISISTKLEQLIYISLNPEIVSIIASNPNRMSITALMTFVPYLKQNKQNYQRYEVVLWKKIFYPMGMLVMVSLSIPFAYLHARSGLIGIKVFSGILLGLSFLLLNTLFSHIGILSTWPAPLTTSIPSLFYSLIALSTLRWIDRC